MSKKLSDSLSKFISSESSFDAPFDDEASEVSSSIKPYMEESNDNEEEPSKKRSKKKKDKLERVLERGDELLNEIYDDELADDFDDFVGNFLFDDEDTELRRNLVRYGRKYARDTKVSGETSEISKAYSESEKRLNDLLKELDDDKDSVQKDITNIRMTRTRNYKTLSDLINAKSQFHNTQLNVIKELNAMTKNQFDLQMKVDKTKKEEANDDAASNKAIQQLFGLGRSNLVGPSGGYSEISGSAEAGMDSEENSYSSLVDEDEIIHKKYFNDEEEETDGDKFLKYEGKGVHYILLYDEDSDAKEIIAEDSDGNIIPDYPLPAKDPNDLDFDISPSTNTATDNLANQYQLRKM